MIIWELISCEVDFVRIDLGVDLVGLPPHDFLDLSINQLHFILHIYIGVVIVLLKLRVNYMYEKMFSVH